MNNKIKNMLKKIYNYNINQNKIIRLQRKSKKMSKLFSRIDRIYENKIYKKYHCCISTNADLGENLILPHPLGIVIGSGVKLGKNVTIYQNVTIGQKNWLYPKIGNNVTIYAGAVIIGDINIGNNVIIGANAVVTKDIPDNSICAGVPAKIIKSNPVKNNE